MNNDYLIHYGVLGMKWGVRRYQDSNGRLTTEGRKRYYSDGSKKSLETRINERYLSKIKTKKPKNEKQAKRIAEAKERLTRNLEINKQADKLINTGKINKYVYNRKTAEFAAKKILQDNIPVHDAIYKAKTTAWRNTAIFVAAYGALTYAQLKYYG